MPELIGYDENGTPQYSFSDEDKLKGISVRPYNALLDPAPVEAEQSPLPVDITGIGAVPNQTTGFTAVDKLFGLNGQERFQTWPERMVRSGVSLAHDVAAGELPVTDDSGGTNDELIRRAQDMAGLAGGATLGINPAEMTVASGMTKMAKNGAKLTPVEGNPFVTDVFHGTPNPGFIKFNQPNSAEFMIDRALGVHVSKDPAISVTFAKENGGIYPAKIPDDSKFLEVDQPHLPYIKDTSVPKTPSNVLSDQSQIEQLVMKTAFQKDPELLARYLTQARAVPENDALKLAKDMTAGKKVDLPVDGEGWDLDRFLRNFGGRPYNREDSAKAVDLFKKDMQDKGYVGLKYINTSPMETANAKDPTSYIVFDPSKHIVSKYTNMLMSDTQKPGMALSALEKPAPVFYSALENAVNNITANKMPADQWLGTLTNAKGVRPEEMEWTGLKDFLAEQKGPVTKDQVQQYLDANKVELKEVNKGESNYYRPIYKETLPRQMANFEPILKEINSIEDVELAQKHNIAFKETTRGYDKEQILQAVQEAKKIPTFDEIAGKNFDTEAEALKAIKDANAENHLQINPINEYKDTKFASYQLPGGTNYQEKLLTLPNEKPLQLEARRREIEKLGRDATPEQKQEWADIMNRLKPDDRDIEGISRFKGMPDFKSSHWDEPNVLAHVRMNDRVIDGKKSLHLEEIQSDWHQLARDKGYAISADKIEKLRPQFEKIDNKLLNSNDEQLLGHPEVDGMLKMAVNKKIITPDEAKIYKQVSDTAQTGAVPDAPFKKTWHELVLKRMLREAAEKGYDRLSWTPGEAQALRYQNEIRQKIDNIEWHNKSMGKTDPEGNKQILITPTNGSEIELTIDKKGNIIKGHGELKGKGIDEAIGKDFAKQILEKDEGNVNTKGYVMGAEGMKGFYDQIIPKALEKIGKEHGVKVKQSDVETHRGYPATFQLIAKNGDHIKDFKTREDAMAWAHDNEVYNSAKIREAPAIPAKTEPIHYIDIPQSLKDQALRKGFPLFSSGVMLSPVEQSPFEPKLTLVDKNPFE